MNKIIQKCLLFLAVPCILAVTGYCALLYYYKENIPYGTWVNDVYCTGLNYEEVAELLLEQDQTVVWIDVIDAEGRTHTLNPKEPVYTISYVEGLADAVASGGVVGLFKEKFITHQPVIKVNEGEWDSYIQNIPLFQVEKLQVTSRMSIVEGEKGFELVDAFENVLDREKASKVVREAIDAGLSQVNLVEAGCYHTPSYSSQDKAVIAEYEALQSFCSRITLDLTIQDEVVYRIDWKVLKDWILRDENGDYVYDKGIGLMLDEAKVKEFAEKVHDETTTYWGRPWQFVDHNGDTIEVEAGNFGWVLKTYALRQAILKAFQERQSGFYELEFSYYPKSASEIKYGIGVGDSYVEVDLTEQHVYLYLDGELALDSPCVTGNVSWDMETPTGVFYIEYKQRNRTLRGPGYATPVKYWMHFYNHCGFHDAGWRKRFGDDIYLKDGSHGCINMPPDKAKELYDQVYAGMPVVVYK